MANLTFSDGVRFNTDGPYRVVRRHDPVRGKPRPSGRGRIARTAPPPTLALAFPKNWMKIDS